MHKAFTEVGVGGVGEVERGQGPVCIMPWRTTVLNGGKEEKEDSFCKNDSF